MFEVADLAFASPATVSRCGMIYMESGALGIFPLVKSWLNKAKTFMPAAHYEAFLPIAKGMYDTLLENAIEFWTLNLKEAVPTSSGNLTNSLNKILESLLLQVLNPQSCIEVAALKQIIEPIFYFSLIWSVGATTDTAGREKFDSWLKGIFAERAPKIQFPNEGSVYDYVFDPTTMEWNNWIDFSGALPYHY